MELIEKDEDQYFEIKASLKYDYEKNQSNKELEYEVAKAIAAFMNAEGGILLIGVTDGTREILGLQKDYKLLGKDKRNRDGFRLHLNNIIRDYLGIDKLSAIEITFPEESGKELCKIIVPKAPAPIFLEREKKKVYEFIVRMQNSSPILNIKDAVEYILRHWNYICSPSAIKPSPESIYQEQIRNFIKYNHTIIKKIQSKGHYLVSIHPDAHQLDRISINELNSRLENATIKTEDWFYPEIQYGELTNGDDYVQRGYEWEEFTQFWRFHTNGHFLHIIGFYDDWNRRELKAKEEKTHDPEYGQIRGVPDTLHLKFLADIIVKIYAFTKSINDFLKSEVLQILIQLKGTLGREITGHHFRIQPTGCSQSLIEIRHLLKTDEIQNYEEAASIDFQAILRIFNVPDYNSDIYRRLIQDEIILIGKLI